MLLHQGTISKHCDLLSETFVINDTVREIEIEDDVSRRRRQAVQGSVERVAADVGDQTSEVRKTRRNFILGGLFVVTMVVF